MVRTRGWAASRAEIPGRAPLTAVPAAGIVAPGLGKPDGSPVGDLGGGLSPDGCALQLELRQRLSALVIVQNLVLGADPERYVAGVRTRPRCGIDS
ncbi:hypothetical protein AB0D13_11445 [Streptomyces sp. NPDC048430]|uniref:hypothetical protein n=1 Tax=unclassified Streptomyces TaxID=2593676 RepID=UPI0034386AA9